MKLTKTHFNRSVVKHLQGKQGGAVAQFSNNTLTVNVQSANHPRGDLTIERVCCKNTCVDVWHCFFSLKQNILK